MAEKTEKATPKKLRDARKKGQVAKSQDFPAAFTFVASLSLVVAAAGFLYKNLAAYMINAFRAIGHPGELQTAGANFIRVGIQVIFNTSLPIMVLVSLIGVLVNFLIIGPLFSMEALKPDIKKLNPVDNLKNMFKLKTFIELVKSVLKITGAVVLIYTVVKGSLPEIISTAGMPLMASALIFANFLIKVAIRVGIFFLVVGIFDLVFQKKNFAKEMKMEKFEVKQEIKDTEGDPQIKGKRKQAAQELAYQEGPNAVRRAKAVITNPVHIAVALEYDAETQPAPKILTMGKGFIADKIIALAQDNDVPIMRNPILAQELYSMGRISQFIPEETYEAVAEILKWIAQLEQAEGFNKELFE
jgi:type III secretion YscU/HrpY family protein